MLEETGLLYEAHKVDFARGEQKTPDYLSLNPNGKIPAIIDPDGPGGEPLALYESGAILLYFACVVISEGTIPARQFDQWDMGLVRPGDAGDEQAALADIIAGIADRNLRAQFDGFLVINGGQRSAA